MAGSIERFCKSTRWFHWTFASSFLVLAGTGATLGLRRSFGLSADATAAVVVVHQIAAVCLFVLPGFVWISGQTAATTRDLRELMTWSRADLTWLLRQPRALAGRADLPPVGKFNAGQKLNGLAALCLTLGLAFTGAFLWLRPGSLVAWAIHVALFLGWIPLFLGHLSLALVLPATRPALRGMLFGRVSREWAEHHHPLWVREMDGERSPRPVPHAEPRPIGIPRDARV